MLDFLQHFSIQFSGLANGKHHFEFQVEDKFFEAIEHSLIERGNVDVHVEVEKTVSMITLLLKCSGHVDVICDRCSIDWKYPINSRHRLILQYGEIDQENQDDEIMYISRNEFQINLAQHIYEFIATTLPLRIVPCEITGNTGLCNEDILKKLNEIQDQKDLNQNNQNPLWEKLRNIKIDNKK